jgi:uncharacterized protein (DUF1800 family)
MTRDRLRAGWTLCLALGVVAFTACDTTLPLREHVLNRIGYGPSPWALERMRVLGIQGYIEEQLNPQTLDDSGLEAEIASRWPLTTWTLPRVRTTYHEYNAANPAFLPGAVRQQMAFARMLRNVQSKRQLQQVLVDFWHNHFNVDARSEIARWGVVTYEREAIRPHVLGRFRDMLGAVAEHPSMLEYLDNAQNFIPGFVRGQVPFGPNENYARELLELHTVGVDAGYTLGDIQEVARAFTGWTVNQYFADGSLNYFADRFEYLDAGHDKGSKSIMGALFIPAGGGQGDGRAVLDFLAQHPKTAHFVAFKLAQRFVAESPPPALVDRAAATFTATGGNLREVTRTILLSSEFLDGRYRRQKVKRPQHFIASLARAVGVTDNVAFTARADAECTRMGEELYGAAPPTGYPERSAFWTGGGPFISRANLALWAAYGLYGFAPVTSANAADPLKLTNELAARLVLAGVHVTTVSRVADLANQIPEWGRAREVGATLLASPEFLVH